MRPRAESGAGRRGGRCRAARSSTPSAGGCSASCASCLTTSATRSFPSASPAICSGAPTAIRRSSTRCARILDDQSEHAQRLIEDIERTSRVLRGELVTRPRPCNLEQVVAQGVDAARQAGVALGRDQHDASRRSRSRSRRTGRSSPPPSRSWSTMPRGSPAPSRSTSSSRATPTTPSSACATTDRGSRRIVSIRSSSRSSPPTPSIRAGASASASCGWWLRTTVAPSRPPRAPTVTDW